MIKFKNCAIFFICIFTLFLISINIFMLFSHKKLIRDVENLSTIKNNISSLDEFKEKLINIEHYQKFYILSQNEDYKKEYDQSVSDAYAYLNNLYDDKCISLESRNDIQNMLEEYEEVNLKLLNNKSFPVNSETQNYLSKSNTIQLDMMRSISDAISDRRNTTSEKQLSLSESINSQKSFIQALSSITTVIVGGPLCYVFKKCKTEQIKLNGFSDILNDQKTKLDAYSDFIIYFSILNKHNKEMRDKWSETAEKIKKLEKSIKDLKKEISHHHISSKKIDSIEIQILEIKMMVNELPLYHEFVVSLSDSIIKIDKVVN